MSYGDWQDFIPIYGNLRREDKAEKAEGKAVSGAAKAQEKSAEAQAELSGAEQRYAEYMASLERRKREQKEHQQQAELARKFEQGRRGEVGMGFDALDVLYDSQQQLAEEQLEFIKDNVEAETQGGIPSVKFPWKSTLTLAAIGLGVWYWRK